MIKSAGPVITDDFKKEAVRLIATNGRVGISTLTRWKRQFHEADRLSGPHEA